jgi:hypothetical protein
MEAAGIEPVQRSARPPTLDLALVGVASAVGSGKPHRAFPHPANDVRKVPLNVPVVTTLW